MKIFFNKEIKTTEFKIKIMITEIIYNLIKIKIKLYPNYSFFYFFLSKIQRKSHLLHFN